MTGCYLKLYGFWLPIGPLISFLTGEPDTCISVVPPVRGASCEKTWNAPVLCLLLPNFYSRLVDFVQGL